LTSVSTCEIYTEGRGSGKGYDHWDYKDEKREAMEKWAAYIGRLLNPGVNVVELSEARA
jgi:hypothetical protein